MLHRMTFDEFRAHCQQDVLFGYGLRDQQNPPITYHELVLFMTDRLDMSDINDAKIGINALKAFLLDNQENDSSCSPGLDARHVSAVLLIGELAGRDLYVAQLPADEDSLILPPPQTVRELIAYQAN